MTLAIYGVGGFAREITPLARAVGDVVFVSDAPDEIDTIVNGLRVHAFEDLDRLAEVQVVIAVADAQVRRRLAAKCEAAGFKIGNLSARSHDRGEGVHVQPGGIFCGFSTCTANSVIGHHFQCNLYSYVAHDCVLGDYVTLAPRVCINGNTIIEDDVYIGTGAILKQGTPEEPLRIGRGAIIGMGAVVTKNVEPGVTVIGSPARPLVR